MKKIYMILPLALILCLEQGAIDYLNRRMSSVIILI